MDDSLKRAIDKIGGHLVAAQHLGISRQAVGHWKRCPAKRVLQIESLSGIPRSELRPDLYPPEPRRAGARRSL